jgi:2-polyprenyl-3-methyl-5-hydroxy-6-metoxy-1,4-benzoquinol methylase
MSTKEVPTDFFEAAYRGENDRGHPSGHAQSGADGPVWDIGKPQQPLIDLEAAGKVRGHVLDAGCGTGDVSLYLAARGYAVTAFDIASTAVDHAKEKAQQNGLDATFSVADARNYDGPSGEFDTVIDCGLFHNFSDPDRAHYVDMLRRVCKSGAHVHILCFSDIQPGDWGPRRVSEADLRSTFSNGWSIEHLERVLTIGNVGEDNQPVRLQAWLATAIRT